MLAKTLIALTTLAVAVQAHFGIDYPPMRVDSFEDPYNQYLRPCAGGNSTGNQTEWPLDGGSVVLELHHPTDYIFINLGLANGSAQVTTFNVYLTPEFLNNTGNGTLCIPKLPLPAGVEVQDGTNASIQVVTVNHGGNALYNCADIVFRTSATILSGDACKNTTGSTFIVQDQSTLSQGSGKTGNATSDKPSSAMVGSSVNTFTVSLTLLLAMVVASGLL
ncbi:hypothetical protein TWF694_001146 [Orbilia ellipsospora]|uniref:Copper acquisition factor BIM1-like domain-containing protein n=1 Tax=Orbilia ellipsospora TaxID=2528407 RepID=A0AAV9XS82_9PEZI